MDEIYTQLHSGDNMLVIDSVGYLSDNIINNISIIDGKRNKIIYLDFCDLQLCVGINIFDVKTTDELDKSINFLISYFGRYDSIFGLSEALLFKEILVNIIYTIYLSNPMFNPNIYNISLFLTCEDYRAYMISFLDYNKNYYLCEFWYTYEVAYSNNNFYILDAIQYILSTLYIFNDTNLYKLISQNKTTVDFSDIRNNIVICKMPRVILGNNYVDILIEFLFYKCGLDNSAADLNVFINKNDLPINANKPNFNFFYIDNTISYTQTIQDLLSENEIISKSHEKHYSLTKDIIKQQNDFSMMYMSSSETILD